MASVFTCTACSVSFSTSEAHKTHYKLDWHRYNLRRKVAGLAPVDQGDFDRHLAAALRSGGPKKDFQGRCKECRKSFRSEGLYKQHLHSKKHKEAVKHMAAAAEAMVTTTATAQPEAAAEEAAATSSTPSSASMAGGGDTLAAAAVADPGAGATSGAARDAVQMEKAAAAMSAEAGDGGGGSKSATEAHPAEEGEGEEDDDDEEEGAEELVPPRMGPGVCIFCNLESSGFEENCSHMLQKHGFFIPDVEFLKDPEGLVGYVEEKVKLGNICLYCNGKGKTFHTYRALQQHMTDRSHCKLLYDENEDLYEYESFYDFSASYSDADRGGLVADGDTSATASAAADGEGEGDSSDGEAVEVSRTLGVTDLGELVLLDGKTVGNRKWSRYYKQRLRTPDERDMVVAHRRATRLRLGAMYDEEMQKGTSTGGAVALQRGQRKAYGGLAGVSRPKDVKMLRAHQRSEARERLKTEIRQNKLNKTFDRIMDM